MSESDKTTTTVIMALEITSEVELIKAADVEKMKAQAPDEEDDK